MDEMDGSASDQMDLTPLNNASVLSSTDLTAILYRHFNQGEIVTPLTIAPNTTLPTPVVDQLDEYDLKFDELDGYLQRALLWDAGYALQSHQPSTENGASTTTNASGFIKIYTRGGRDMSEIALTRSDVESSGCQIQLCSSELGSVWRAVSCSGEQLESALRCAIDPADAANVERVDANGRQRSLWASRNTEDRSTPPPHTGIAVPSVNVARHDWIESSTGKDTEVAESDKKAFSIYAIHTVPFRNEPAVGQCPQQQLDNAGNLLPSIIIPCAVLPSGSSESMTGGAAAWERPQSSRLLTSWLKQTKAPTSNPAAPGPRPVTTPKSSPEQQVGGNVPSGDLPSRNNSSSGSGFNPWTVVSIILAGVVLIAVVIGFVMTRKRKRRRASQSPRASTRKPRLGHFVTPSSAFKTENDDGYLDGAAFLSPTPLRPQGSRLADEEDEDSHSRQAIVPVLPGLVDPDVYHSEPGRGHRSDKLKMTSLRRAVSEPGSSKIPRPSLDAEHVHRLQTDPFLSASRINYDKIVLERVIARRSQYEIWLAQYEGDELAVKRLVPPVPVASRTNDNDMDDEDHIQDDIVAAFISEIQMTARLEHANLSRFVGVAWSRLPADSLCLVMEYQPHGELRRYLQRFHDDLTWPGEKYAWAIGIGRGMRYLHAQNPAVLHMELHTAHILLSEDMEPKIIDFAERYCTDWSHLRRSGEDLASTIQFPYWAAPEVLKGEAHRTASDVYSFGMILVELDTCKMPFQTAKNTSNGHKLKPFQLLNMILAGRLHVELSETCPPSVDQLIELCLHPDPARRPTMVEVVKALERASYE